MTERNYEAEARKIRYAWLKMDEPEPWSMEAVFDKIYSVMAKLPALKGATDSLDYALAERYTRLAQQKLTAEEWQSFGWVQPIVSTGGSEGIYVDVSLIRLEEQNIPHSFGVFKTLREDFEGYLLMGQIAGAYVKLFEEWQWANMPEEK